LKNFDDFYDFYGIFEKHIFREYDGTFDYFWEFEKIMIIRIFFLQILGILKEFS